MAVDRGNNLTLKQAAVRVGMSIEWFYLIMKQGDGPKHKRRGRLYIFDKDEFDEWASQDRLPTCKRHTNGKRSAA